MGDEILKRLLFVILILISFLYAEVKSISTDDIDIQKYDMLFQNIDKQRVGMKDSVLNRVRSPFVSKRILHILKDKNATISSTKKRDVFRLYGIINNRVKIGRRWYKIGSKAFGYRVYKIKNSSVILKRKRKKIELFLRKRDGKIKITKVF